MTNDFQFSNFPARPAGGRSQVNFQVINLKIRKLVTNWRLETGDWKLAQGFTLIELLVVISIIGILIGLSVFGLQGARKSSRDAVRKADLEEIRSGLGMYKSDCNVYPVTANFRLNSTTKLIGDDDTSKNCLSSNVYISKIPTDPIPADYYSYSSDGITYYLCAALEVTPSPAMDVDNCGSCGGAACNYEVSNP